MNLLTVSKTFDGYRAVSGDFVLFLDEERHVRNIDVLNRYFGTHFDGKSTVEEMSFQYDAPKVFLEFMKRLNARLNELDEGLLLSKKNHEEMNALKTRRYELGQLIILALSIVFLIVVISVVFRSENVEIDNPNSLKNNMFWS